MAEGETLIVEKCNLGRSLFTCKGLSVRVFICIKLLQKIEQKGVIETFALESRPKSLLPSVSRPVKAILSQTRIAMKLMHSMLENQNPLVFSKIF